MPLHYKKDLSRNSQWMESISTLRIAVNEKDQGHCHRSMLIDSQYR